MDFLDSHRPYRPDCNGKDLPPKVASTGCTSAMSELAAFGLHSTCLPEEVSRPFWWGEGKKDRKRNGELAKSEKNGFRSGLNAVF